MTKNGAVTLADVCESVRYGYTASATDNPTGTKFLRITDIVPEEINWDTVPFCEIDESEKLRVALDVGDIVIARTGATVGYAKLIREPVNAVFASYLVRFRVNNKIADPGFIGRLVESQVYKSFVQSRIGGAAQPNASAPTLGSFKFQLPAKLEQSRISNVLSGYDDLIKNNARRIKLLEESVRQLYKEWFVRVRFPGYEHTQIIKGIPAGWRKIRLDEIAEIVMGQSPESRFYNSEGEGLPFHQGVTGYGERFISHEIYSTASNRVAEPEDILCSVRAPVGRLNITMDKIIIGRGLSAIRSKSGHQSMLYYQLRNHFFKEDMIGSGAIYASVTKEQLASQELLTPTEVLIRQFESNSVEIDKQIRNLFLQNIKLKQARDLLLPRLMNGEIVV